MSEEVTTVVADTLNAIASAAGRKTARCKGHGWYGTADVDTLVFSYRADFAALWGIGESNGGLDSVVQGLAGRALTLVIAWDGQPEDTAADVVAVGRYVTPYEWAAALSLVLYRRYAENPECWPKTRILIFDIASHNFPAKDDLFVKRSLFAFHNAFPWIQDYRPVERADGNMVEAVIVDGDPGAYALLRQAIPPEYCGAECLIEDIAAPQRVLTTFEDDNSHLDALEAFAESWRQQFLKAGSRHDVANLLGPMLLSRGLPAKVQETILTNALPRLALHDLVVQIGLLGEVPNQDDNAGIGLLVDGGPFGRLNGVGFLLVDDQYRLGYQHILGHAIFDKAYHPNGATISDNVWQYQDNRKLAKLKCVHACDLICDLFPDDKVKIADWALPRRLALPDSDVLLLDLRLWLDSQIDLRKDVMKRLIQVCNNLGTKKIQDDKFHRAFAAAEAISISEQTSNKSELTALALLPLLLSHYDPSLPIVLFSSTHQREVLEMVGHRPNIITGFSKPLLTGYGDGQRPEEAVSGLVAALKRALRLHEARSIWIRLCDDGFKWERPYPPFMTREVQGQTTSNWTWNEDNGAYLPESTIAPEYAYKPKLILQPDHLRKRLAFIYRHYLLSEKYYDFASVPRELVEGALTPPMSPLLVGTRIFAGLCPRGIDNIRNELEACLRNCRNRKAHGHAEYPDSSEKLDLWRLISFLQFHILLDWIIGKEQPFVDEAKFPGKGISDYIKRTYSIHISTLPSYSNTTLTVSDLSTVEVIPWPLYALYAAAQAVWKSRTTHNRETVTYASELTFTAIIYLASKWFRLPTDFPEGPIKVK